MIRHFTLFYKQNLRKFDLDGYLAKYNDDLSYFRASCPICKRTGMLTPFTSYSRSLISPAKDLYGDYDYRPIRILRLRCIREGCKHTHALIPEILIPYRSYSLLFILLVLKEYFLRSLSSQTVASIASKYGIAVSTLYLWKKQFLLHRRLWLGALAAAKEIMDEFLTTYCEHESLSEGLKEFFLLHGFSFMQETPRRETSDTS